MDIEILPRMEAVRRYGVRHEDDIVPMTAVISITTPDPPSEDWGPVAFDEDALLAVLPMEFGDVLPDEPTAMTEEQGQEIVDFVRRIRGLGAEHLVVHCDGGVSRSAGVAAAIGLMIGTGDWFVFDDPWYCPNMGCYRKVLNAAMMDVDDDEIDAKERHNIDLWYGAREDDFE